MKKLLISVALVALMLPVFSQSVQTVINVPRDQWGGTYPALLYKPGGYDTSTKRYPLLIFAHGKGEGGSTGGMEVLYNNSGAGGPAYFIEHAQWPVSFTNPKDGQSYQFIVLSPRAKGSGWTYGSSNLDYFIRHMVANYRIDTNRIYVTGLSAGGATLVEYVGHGPVGGVPFNGRYKVAAFVPMSQAYGDPAQVIANNIVADSVRTWGFGDNVCNINEPGGCDGHGENTAKLINKINIAKAGFGRFTHYQGGHCCWGNFYNPTYYESVNGQSMNIYEWMLQFSRAPITVNPDPNPEPGVTRYIKVRLYGGANPYTTGGWNNWNIASNLSSGALQFSTGESSTITVTTNYTTSVADNGTAYAVTMCPQAVGRYASYASYLDATFTITGLDNNKTYDVETYNTRDKIGPFVTEVSIGGVMRSIVTDTNYANKAVFTNLSPTDGTIVFTLHRPNNSTYHYINGFQLTEQGNAGSGLNNVLTVAATTEEDAWVKAGWQGSPNPFRDFIVVGATFEQGQRQLTVNITDIAGRVVYSKSYSNIPAGVWRQRLELSGVVRQKGIYLMRVSGPSLAKPVTLRLLKD